MEFFFRCLEVLSCRANGPWYRLSLHRLQPNTRDLDVSLCKLRHLRHLRVVEVRGIKSLVLPPLWTLYPTPNSLLLLDRNSLHVQCLSSSAIRDLSSCCPSIESLSFSVLPSDFVTSGLREKVITSSCLPTVATPWTCLHPPFLPFLPDFQSQRLQGGSLAVQSFCGSSLQHLCVENCTLDSSSSHTLHGNSSKEQELSRTALSSCLNLQTAIFHNVSNLDLLQLAELPHLFQLQLVHCYQLKVSLSVSALCSHDRE